MNLLSVPGLALLCSLGACASIPPAGSVENPLAAEAEPDQIRWPERYQPEDVTFFVHNEIEIAADPATVWSVLVEAETWPGWYEGAAEVRVLDAEDGLLAPDVRFSWTTMGLDFESRIVEFEPPVRLSWESRKRSIKGYHGWLLIPTPTGTRLVTDEGQYGVLAWLQGIFIPRKLERLHDTWLALIKARAEERVQARAAEG